MAQSSAPQPPPACRGTVPVPESQKERVKIYLDLHGRLLAAWQANDVPEQRRIQLLESQFLLSRDIHDLEKQAGSDPHLLQSLRDTLASVNAKLGQLRVQPGTAASGAGAVSRPTPAPSTGQAAGQPDGSALEQQPTMAAPPPGQAASQEAGGAGSSAVQIPETLEERIDTVCSLKRQYMAAWHVKDHAEQRRLVLTESRFLLACEVHDLEKRAGSDPQDARRLQVLRHELAAVTAALEQHLVQPEPLSWPAGASGINSTARPPVGPEERMPGP
ncbi:hypothetical protein ABPG75_005724 [Micractinium tetrahymenae]